MYYAILNITDKFPRREIYRFESHEKRVRWCSQYVSESVFKFSLSDFKNSEDSVNIGNCNLFIEILPKNHIHAYKWNYRNWDNKEWLEIKSLDSNEIGQVCYDFE